MQTVKLANIGTDLSSRTSARLFRLEYLERESALPIALDLSGVRMMTGGFADELLAVLFMERGSAWFRRNVHLVGASHYVKDSIITAVADRTACLAKNARDIALSDPD